MPDVTPAAVAKPGLVREGQIWADGAGTVCIVELDGTWALVQIVTMAIVDRYPLCVVGRHLRVQYNDYGLRGYTLVPDVGSGS